MVKVEWQYYQTKLARSSHFIPGPYFICTQFAVRSPWSLVLSPQSGRSPQFAADLRRSTRLRCVHVMLQGYKQNHTYQRKNIQIISLKTSRPWYKQALDCCWRNISAKTWTPLLHYKTTAILFAVAPLPVLPTPPVTVIFGLFSIFVFLEYENQKPIFISDFIIIDTVSRSFVTHE